MPLHNLDISSIPEMASYEVLESEFNYVRDTRFIHTSDPGFPRRLTWLYPDDGCYARAEMAKRKLVEHHQVAPKKVFVFGDLMASTPNTADGSITWWYHVAAIYRVGMTAYVFDPSIEPRHPMTLEDWNAAVGGNQNSVQFALCAPNAFDPDSDCNTPKEVAGDTIATAQRSFLSPEWRRLQDLHRDPKKELGEFPPWLE
jgi:hypothetical protein